MPGVDSRFARGGSDILHMFAQPFTQLSSSSNDGTSPNSTAVRAAIAHLIAGHPYVQSVSTPSEFEVHNGVASVSIERGFSVLSADEIVTSIQIDSEFQSGALDLWQSSDRYLYQLVMKSVDGDSAEIQSKRLYHGSTSQHQRQSSNFSAAAGESIPYAVLHHFLHPYTSLGLDGQGQVVGGFSFSVSVC